MPTTSPIQAVIFDMDDTLYPERQYVRSGYRAVGRYLDKRAATPCLSDQGVTAADWLWRRFLNGQTGRAFDALNDEFSLGLTTDDIASMVTLYREHCPDIEPYPDVNGLLETIGLYFRMGLLSDGFLPAQRLKLDTLGLEKFFQAVVFTEDLGRAFWKPSPVAFQKIAQLLDAPARTCVYIGDNPAKDFIAPRALGWTSIYYRRAGQVHASKLPPPTGKPDATVTTNAELLSLLLP